MGKIIRAVCYFHQYYGLCTHRCLKGKQCYLEPPDYDSIPAIRSIVKPEVERMEGSM